MSSFSSNKKQKITLSFPQFKQLSDDTVLSILAFVGDVPYEPPCMDRAEDGQSTLTSVLPYISKKIHSILEDSEYLWKLALERLVRNDPRWKCGLQQYVFEHNDTKGENSISHVENNFSSGSDLLNESIRVLRYSDRLKQREGVFCSKFLHQRIFKWVLIRIHSWKIKSPLFYMPGRTKLGERFGLHFFEPRYRTLIAEIMAPFPASERRGKPITSTPKPTFIYANRSRLNIGTIATIVEVVVCRIYQDGTADVILEPSAYARIEKAQERPDAGQLWEGEAVKLQRFETHETDQSSDHLDL